VRRPPATRGALTAATLLTIAALGACQGASDAPAPKPEAGAQQASPAVEEKKPPPSDAELSDVRAPKRPRPRAGDRQPMQPIDLGKASLVYSGPAKPSADLDRYELHPWKVGERAFVAVDRANLRKEPSKDGAIAGQLPLAAEVKIKRKLEPSKVGHRVGRWYEVDVVGAAADDPKRTGFVFDSTLTPLAGKADLDGDGEDETWAVAWTARFRVAVRIGEPALASEDRRSTGFTARVERKHPSQGGTLRVRGARAGGGFTLLMPTVCPKARPSCAGVVISYVQEGGPVPRALGKAQAVTRLQVADGEPTLRVRDYGFDDGDLRNTWYRDGSEWKNASCPSCGSRKLSELAVHKPVDRFAPAVEADGLAPKFRGKCQAIGKIERGPHEGRTLINCPVDPADKAPVPTSANHRFIEDREKLILVGGRGDSLVLKGMRLVRDRVVGKDPGATVTGLIDEQKHHVLYEDARGKVVGFAKTAASMDKRDEERMVFVHRELGPVWTPGALTADGAPAFGDEGLFVPVGSLLVHAADGETGIYRYEPGFTNESINWEVDELAHLGGNYTHSSSFHSVCGMNRYFSAVVELDDASLERVATVPDKEGRPMPIWRAKKGDAYYGEFLAQLRGAQAEAAKAGATGLSLPSADKLYDDFAFFFWRDSFGRLLRFTKSDYEIPDLCEPVLYLYPEAEQAVRVRVGGVAIARSAPRAIANEWSVVARPDGRVRGAGGALHDYLFWEGEGGRFSFPSRGAVVARDDVEDFLRRSVVTLGLRGREVHEFVDTWTPRLTRYERVAIAFHDRETIDRLAPMSIEPAPDHVIRLLMDWRPVAEGHVLAPQRLRDVARPGGGFVAVEWGGVMR
jgi:hypothetical protein